MLIFLFRICLKKQIGNDINFIIFQLEKYQNSFFPKSKRLTTNIKQVKYFQKFFEFHFKIDSNIITLINQDVNQICFYCKNCFLVTT